jgi:hypothetical protein
MKRVQNVGQFTFELHVNNGAHDLGNFAGRIITHRSSSCGLNKIV